MQFGCMAGEMQTSHRYPQKKENSVQCGMGEKGQRDILSIHIYIYGYYIYTGHYIYMGLYIYMVYIYITHICRLP